MLKKQKGQYLTIEYVFFFAIGVAMVIGIYFTFMNINSNLRETTITGQLHEVGEKIRGTIINTFETASSTNSKIYYKISIPTSLSGCVYAIKINSNLELNCTDNYKIGAILSLYGINTEESMVYSSNGAINIINENGLVRLE